MAFVSHCISFLFLCILSLDVCVERFKHFLFPLKLLKLFELYVFVLEVEVCNIVYNIVKADFQLDRIYSHLGGKLLEVSVREF